ncbi:hypothetical protein EVAR_90190_1 [Eumeta japonica]|uniref:Uncharacterized protein n=1 Tax=Eumeta variegata TaxID=151549 RepID=A0A4C1WUR7_EUMVA|nr:hypothetical protein EVAR_90190_1 [Eumeta japonica]
MLGIFTLVQHGLKTAGDLSDKNDGIVLCRQLKVLPRVARTVRTLTYNRTNPRLRSTVQQVNNYVGQVSNLFELQCFPSTRRRLACANYDMNADRCAYTGPRRCRPQSDEDNRDHRLNSPRHGTSGPTRHEIKKLNGRTNRSRSRSNPVHSSSVASYLTIEPSRLYLYLFGYELIHLTLYIETSGFTLRNIYEYYYFVSGTVLSVHDCKVLKLNLRRANTVDI